MIPVIVSENKLMVELDNSLSMNELYSHICSETNARSISLYIDSNCIDLPSYPDKPLSDYFHEVVEVHCEIDIIIDIHYRNVTIPYIYMDNDCVEVSKKGEVVNIYALVKKAFDISHPILVLLNDNLLLLEHQRILLSNMPQISSLLVADVGFLSSFHS